MENLFNIPTELKFKITTDIEQHLKKSIEDYANKIIDEQIKDFRLKLESQRLELVKDITARLASQFDIKADYLEIRLPINKI